MSCNTKVIHIQIILMHTFLYYDFWTPLQPVRMWQVPLCAPTVIGPEVKTEYIYADIYSSHYTYKHIHANHKQSIIKHRYT